MRKHSDPDIQYLLATVDAIKEHLDAELPEGVERDWPKHPRHGLELNHDSDKKK